MAEDLKVGDVVLLKTGTNKMVIEGIGQYGMTGVSGPESALCVWVNDKNKREEGVFALTSLVKVEDTPPASGPSRASFKR